MGACCGKEQIEYTSESYYAPTSWDFFEEKFVAFGAETDEVFLFPSSFSLCLPFSIVL